MTIARREIYKLIALLCEEESLYVTVKGSLKGGLITGASAAAGGLLLGPVGLAIGGALGGFASYKGMAGKFKSVVHVIRDLPEHKKAKLYEGAVRVVKNLDATDAIALFALVRADSFLYSELLHVVTNFVTSDLNMTLKG